jgi:outer membrane protein TolC
MIRISFIILFLILAQLANGQASLKAVLDSIVVNNLQIKASSENRDAEVVLAKTGISPDDPTIDYGYFPGSNQEIGTKTTLNVMQSFYFPTVYARKKTGASLSAEKSGEIHLLKSRQILNQAASTYIELVYLTKYTDELKKRTSAAENAKSIAEKRIKSGDANQLELNKARIEALHWSNELRTNTTRRDEKWQLLVAMNGGKPITITKPEYPLWLLLPVDTIYLIASQKDPLLKALGYDQKITANNVKLQNSLWIPQFKAGYGQETITQGTYRGFQAGISIPIWQNKNGVKYARLQQQSTESNLAAYFQQLKSTIKARYQVVSSLKTSVDEYRKVIESMNSLELLEKSLQLGNISILEYYRELSAWYETYDRYSSSERDYYSEMVFLMQFNL